MPTALGPVEWIAIAFPGGAINNEIVTALVELVDAGTVRIIDLLLVRKDGDGVVTASELDVLEPADLAPFDALDGDVLGLLSEDDIALAGEALEPDSTAALLVWENLWATSFAEAVRSAGGRIAAHDRIPFDVVQAALKAAVTEGAVS